jgi:hypothetical protein
LEAGQEVIGGEDAVGARRKRRDEAKSILQTGTVRSEIGVAEKDNGQVLTAALTISLLSAELESWVKAGENA